MSNEVKPFTAWKVGRVCANAAGAELVVLHSDYAALEAECERLRASCQRSDEDQRNNDAMLQEALKEFDTLGAAYVAAGEREHQLRTELHALAAELAAIRAAGGEQVEAAFQLPAPCCEVADEKYNRCFFYRRTGDQTKRYHQPGTKLVALDEVEPVFAAMLAQHQRIVAAMAAELAGEANMNARHQRTMDRLTRERDEARAELEQFRSAT